MLLVYRAHESCCWRQDLIDEDEDRLLGRQLDSLADHVDELAHGEIGGDQVLLLVDGRNVRLLDLFADDLQRERRHVSKKFSLTLCNIEQRLGMSSLTGMRSAYF